MAANPKLLLKVLSPQIMAKALTTLDKSTAIVVGCCWAAALVMLLVAVLQVHATIAAKKEAADAEIAEPVLPVATTAAIDAREAQSIFDRLQRQFPDLKCDLDGNQVISIRAQDPAKFHQWITALSYVDTMAPQFRWALKDFCVGSCGGGELMKASLSGQRVSFALPPQS